MVLAVTAVIPVHNHARWVNDAIESVASQDYQPRRIVVVDDGSADGSSEAVLATLKDVRNVMAFTGPARALGVLRGHDIEVLLARLDAPVGPAAARNWGIQAAWEQTDIFALLDSDDLYLPGKISSAIRVFEEHPQVGVVYSDYDTLRPDGVTTRQYKEPFSRRRLLSECIVNCDSLVSKAVFEKVGLFHPPLRVAEDYDLWLRISEHFVIHHIPEPQVRIRVGPHSSTSTVAQKRWQENMALVHQRLLERQHAR